MHRFSLIAASAVLLTAGTAFAACQDELAALEGGVAKDGAAAPLDAPATPQTGGEPATKSTDPPTILRRSRAVGSRTSGASAPDIPAT